MNFLHEKKQFLQKPDKSTKGSIDEPLVTLISKINSLDNYYTTSSCSGRVMIVAQSEKKAPHQILYSSHEKLSSLSIPQSPQNLTLQYDPVIVHICCDSISSAHAMLDALAKAGLKHSGITSLKKIIIEMRGNDWLSVPLTYESKQLVDDAYLSHLIEVINRKVERNKKLIDKLHYEIDQRF